MAVTVLGPARLSRAPISGRGEQETQPRPLDPTRVSAWITALPSGRCRRIPLSLPVTASGHAASTPPPLAPRTGAAVPRRLERGNPPRNRRERPGAGLVEAAEGSPNSGPASGHLARGSRPHFPPSICSPTGQAPPRPAPTPPRGSSPPRRAALTRSPVRRRLLQSRAGGSAEQPPPPPPGPPRPLRVPPCQPLALASPFPSIRPSHSFRPSPPLSLRPASRAGRRAAAVSP